VPDRSFDFRPLAFLAILALAGCEGSPSSPPAISPGSRGVNAAQEGNVEGEILGVVWVGDTLAGPDSRFRVQLQPDAATQAALSSIPGLDFSNSVFVQGDLTKVQWDYFVWGDPDGGNNGLCTGDPIKDVEVHMQFDASTGTRPRNRRSRQTPPANDDLDRFERSLTGPGPERMDREEE